MKTLACGLWALLIWLSAAPVHARTGAEADFARAYRHYSLGDHARAEALFRSALGDPDLVLADYALYHLGRIAAHDGRRRQARDHFTRLKQSYPGSVWSAEASFALVEIDLARKRYQEAARRAAALNKKGYGKEPRARAAYYLGRAHEALGRTGKAYGYHQEARRRAPRSDWAGRARERVRELRRQHPERFGLRGGDAMLREAKQLGRERDYPAAAELYRRVLRETKFRRLSLEGLAAVYRQMRLRDREEQILRRYVRHYPHRAEAGKALTRIAIIQWNRNDNAAALATLRTFLKQHPGHLRRRFALYVIGRIHESMGRRKAAIRSYRELFAKEHRLSRFRNDAAWRLGWMHYLAADYRSAKTRFHDLSHRRGAYRWAAAFWEGRTAEKLNDADDAVRLYRRVVRKDPDSYYAILAAGRLARLGVAVPVRAEDPRQEAGAPQLDARARLHLARARALTRLGLHRLAPAELDRVRKHAKRTAGLRLLLMREYARSGAHHRSLSLAQQLPPSPETLRVRYPLAYWDAVRRHAGGNGPDPYLVLSVMRQESRFKPQAVSRADAFGLMQLIRTTAASEASRLGLPEPGPHALFDPELNIRLGAHHLRGLLQHYGHSRARALAAYNAGKEAVARWTRDLGSGDDTEFVERITYRETRRYVKAVLRNYHAYRTLYGDAPPE